MWKDNPRTPTDQITPPLKQSDKSGDTHTSRCRHDVGVLDSAIFNSTTAVPYLDHRGPPPRTAPPPASRGSACGSITAVPRLDHRGPPPRTAHSPTSKGSACGSTTAVPRLEPRTPPRGTLLTDRREEPP
jgi:hypothetical protein